MAFRFPPQQHRYWANRLARETQSFKVEEKLDKWLDLRRYIWLCDALRAHPRWNKQVEKIAMKFITLDTIYALQQHNVMPSDLSQCVLTPRIISKIHRKTLRPGAVTKCHIRSDRLRQLISTLKTASQRSLAIQVEHLLSCMGGGIIQHSINALNPMLDKFDIWPIEVHQSLLVCEDMLYLLSVKRKFNEASKERNARERIRQRFQKFATTTKNPDPFKISLQSLQADVIITPQLSIMVVDGFRWLLPDDLLLELINKTSEMFCTLVGAYFMSGVNQPPDFYNNTLSYMRHILNHMLGSQLRSIVGDGEERENKPFKLLKAMEGLGVAQIIAKEDFVSGWRNNALLDTMWQELYHSNVVTHPQIEDSPLGYLLLNLNTPEIAELIGIVKLFGHPTIEIDLGVAQLYERTHSNIAINLRAVQLGRGVLTRDITKAFYRKYKRYPKVNLDNTLTDPAALELFRKCPKLETSYGQLLWNRVTTAAWSTVEFGKNGEFDPVDNQLPLIKDKALGMSRSQIFLSLIQETELTLTGGESETKDIFLNRLNYSAEMLRRLDLSQTEIENRIAVINKLCNDEISSTLDSKLELARLRRELSEVTKNVEECNKAFEFVRKARADRAERRTLLAYLAMEDFDEKFKQYFTQYTSGDPWGREVMNYLVIKLTAKELELKSLGRFFGASPPFERNRRIVQEQNVMNLMDDYFPDQLMTPDDLGIMRKLVSFRYFGRLYPDHVLFQISFDFSKWNNNMRHESIDIPAGQLLDKWFNIKLYGKTMLAFQNMLVYADELHYKRYWEGQEGGIEGLNQATWSLIFLGGIKHALETAGFKYQVTVKGDDVRAVIAVPVHQVNEQGGYDRTRDNIMVRIQQLCRDMGWQLNPQESFVSLNLIATSKQYQVRDTWLPSCLKKLMKSLSLSNLIFPTPEDLNGSIYSCAHSACYQSTAVLPCYSVALIISCLELSRSLCSRSVTVEELITLTMWPQLLGGPGSLPLQTFFVRGENDMLSVIVSLYTSILRYHEGPLCSMIKRIISIPFDENPDPLLLLADPYSLALDVPPRSSTVLRSLIHAHLKSWVKNRDIAFLLSDVGKNESEEFVRSISSMRPYLAKVASTMYECSPYFLIQEVLAKFMESPTVITLFTRKRGVTKTLGIYQVLTRMLAASTKRIDFWVTTLRQYHPGDKLTFLGSPSELWLNPLVCPTRLSNDARTACWGFPIEGITYPSLVQQVYIDRKSELINCHVNWHLEQKMFSITMRHKHARPQTTYDSLHYAAAPDSIPWVGSMTQSKVHFPKLQSVIKSPTLSKIFRLITVLRSTASLGREVREVLGKLIGALTVIPLRDILAIQPHGEAGHFAHRLPINAFSMNTMPNFRTNIMQLVDISTDSLSVVKMDNSDRTINFAAIHFMLCALATFPLQMSSKMPTDYPDVLGAIFHPDNWNDDEYNLCRYCASIVPDNYVVRFGVQLPDNLYKYATVSLVGCSHYEETVLQQTINEYMVTRIGESLAMTSRDIGYELRLELATSCLLNSMIGNAITLHTSTALEKYVRVPTGELRNMYASNLGMSNPEKMSIGLLRSVPPLFLYTQTVSNIFSHILEKICSLDITDASHALVELSVKNNPFPPYFQQLIDAGVLTRLVTGSSTAALQAKDFSFQASDLANGTSAASTFIRWHIPLITLWLDGKQDFPYTKHFVDLSNIETMVDKIQSIQSTRMRLWAHAVIKKTSRGGLIAMLNIFLQQSLNIHVPNGTPLADYSKIIEGISAEDLNNAGQTFIRYYLRTEGVQDNHAVTYALVVAYVMTYLPYLVIKTDGGDIYHYISSGHDKITLFATEEPRNWGDDMYSPTMDEFPHWSNVLKRYGEGFVRLMCTIGRHIGLSVYEIPDSLMTVIEGVCEQLGKLVKPLRTIHINYITVEDAQRSVRSATQINADIHQERHRVIQQVLDTYFIEGPLHIDYRPHTDMCTLSNDEDHRSVMGMQTGGLEDIRYKFDYEERLLGDLLSREAYKEMRYATVDPLEFFRCGGRHNTSVTKLADILIKVGCYSPAHPWVTSNTQVVCLADGIGGTTGYMAYLFPKSLVTYNSLQVDVATGFRPIDACRGMTPCEVADPFFTHGEQSRVLYEGGEPGDLTIIDVQDEIIARVRSRAPPVRIVTMDADVNWSAPPDNYRSLLFGALRIFANVGQPDTLGIFKLALIKEEGIAEFIYAIYHLFMHVHVVRSSCTRQHSSETHIVFQYPRLQHSLPTDVDLLSHRKMLFGHHMNIVAVVRDQVSSIADTIYSYRSLLQSRVVVTPADVFYRYSRALLYPIRLSHLLSFFHLQEPGFTFTTKELFDYLLDETDNHVTYIERAWWLPEHLPREVRRLDPNQVVNRDKSLSFFRHVIIKYMKLTVLKSILASTQHLGVRLDSRTAQVIVGQVIQKTINFIGKTNPRLVDNLTFEGSFLTWQDDFAKIYLTHTIRHSFHKFIQLQGSLFYLQSLHSFQIDTMIHGIPLMDSFRRAFSRQYRELDNTYLNNNENDTWELDDNLDTRPIVIDYDRHCYGTLGIIVRDELIPPPEHIIFPSDNNAVHDAEEEANLFRELPETYLY